MGDIGEEVDAFLLCALGLLMFVLCLKTLTLRQFVLALFINELVGHLPTCDIST